MGVRIALSAGEVQLGFDTLLVLGLSASLDAAAGSEALAQVLAAQLYTAGLAFVPQNTSTNNSSEADSGFSPRDPARAETVPALKPIAPPSGSDGEAAARLLGIEPELIGRFDKADGTEQRDARAMNAALWPATGGYFLEQMLADTFASSAIDGAKRHTIDYVRARGPLPALRVGAQPYGLLPVSSLDRWHSRDGEDSFVAVLRALRTRWRSAATHVPRIDRRANDASTEQAILDVLGANAGSCAYTARLVFDHLMFGIPELHRNAPPFPPLEVRRAQLSRLVKELGLAWTPRLLDTVFADQSFLLVSGAVQPSAVGEAGTPDANYIAWLRNSSYETIRDQTGLPNGPPNTLLYLLLRHAVLLAYAMTAFRIQLAGGVASPAELREPAVVDVLATPSRTTGRHPDRGVPGSGSRPLHELSAADHPAAASLDELRTSLERLQALPATSLELLLGETVDLFAYRLDAWITSLATRRLDVMRGTRPRGILLGGFGWVEGVHHGPERQSITPPSGESAPLSVGAGSAGFIHAPSISQAATAAILRSGYLSLQESDAGPFNCRIFLHGACGLADGCSNGVRQGQALGALLEATASSADSTGTNARPLHCRLSPRGVAPFWSATQGPGRSGRGCPSRSWSGCESSSTLTWQPSRPRLTRRSGGTTSWSPRQLPCQGPGLAKPRPT